MLSIRKRFCALFFLFCAAVLVLLLAFGLPNLQLKPGQLLAVPLLAEEGTDAPKALDGLLILIRGMLALLVLILPFFILVSLFTKEGRQKVLSTLILLAILFVLVNLIRPNSQAIQLPSEQAPFAPVLDTPAATLEEEPNPIQSTSPSPLPASPVIDLGILLGIGVLLAGGFALLIWRLVRDARPSTLDLLAEEARSALGALQAGSSAEDAIVRCYEQMCQAVLEQRDVERQSAMTPEEFIHVLTRIGLPAEPVVRLTHLFENVRYGGRQSTSLERADAIHCLTSIVEACQQTRIPQA